MVGFTLTRCAVSYWSTAELLGDSPLWHCFSDVSERHYEEATVSFTPMGIGLV